MNPVDIKKMVLAEKEVERANKNRMAIRHVAHEGMLARTFAIMEALETGEMTFGDISSKNLLLHHKLYGMLALLWTVEGESVGPEIHKSDTCAVKTIHAPGFPDLHLQRFTGDEPTDESFQLMTADGHWRLFANEDLQRIGPDGAANMSSPFVLSRNEDDADTVSYIFQVLQMRAPGFNEDVA